MLGVKSRSVGMSPVAKGRMAVTGGGREALEVRPGGMLVQKRNSDATQSSIPVQMIRVIVKYGTSYHEVSISAQASFGELKKMLAGPTGLNPLDQTLVFKEMERDSKASLDVAGVKDGSRLVLFEDALCRGRKSHDMRKDSNSDKANKEITEIGLEVDKIAKQVSKLELEISCGDKVVDKVVLNLIELLMAQLIKLDGIIADGDVKMRRRLQVKRVQSYIDKLDKLKTTNSLIEYNEVKAKYPAPSSHQSNLSTKQTPIPIARPKNRRNPTPTSVLIRTEWETFNSSTRVKSPVAPRIRNTWQVLYH